MQITPTSIVAFVLLAYTLTQVRDKNKPTWLHRLNSWQSLIGLVALIVAMLIVINPEFCALGILGDSAFFDLLVLAISLQLQMMGTRICNHVAARVSHTI